MTGTKSKFGKSSSVHFGHGYRPSENSWPVPPFRSLIPVMKDHDRYEEGNKPYRPSVPVTIPTSDSTLQFTMNSSSKAQGKGKTKIVDEQALHDQLMDEDSGDDVEFVGNVDEIEAIIPVGYQHNNEEVEYLEPQSPDIEPIGIDVEQHEDDEIELASITIPMRRKAGVAATPGVELDSVTINMEGVRLAEGQSGYEFALEEARRSCPNHEPYHDHNPPPLQ